MRKINRRLPSQAALQPLLDSSPKNYWSWGPGTKILVKSGDFKGLEGVVSRYVPHNTSFHIIFSDKEHAVIAVEDLSEIVDKSVENKKIEEPQESIVEEVIIEPREMPLEVVSTDGQEFISAPTSDVEPEINETPQQTLERLSLRGNGFTLSELTEERGSSVKGPFKRSIKSALKIGKIVKRGRKRNGEDIFICPSLKEDDSSRPEKIVEDSEVTEIVSVADVAVSFGDFLTKLGKFLKSL